MAATWEVHQMQDYIVGPVGPFEGESRVVFIVHWHYTDEQTVDGIAYSASATGSQSLQPFTDGSAFTPWEEITAGQALEWLHEKMSAEEVTRIEERVTAQLHSKINPTTETGIPW
jgi:hypothetical protein